MPLTSDPPSSSKPEMLELQAATPADIPLIQALAHRIWHQCYPGIISQEQIDFMLPWMYGSEQLEREMTQEGIFFFLLRHGGMDAGFAAVGPAAGAEEWHLHKIYLLAECQGRGLGSQALTQLKNFARSLGAHRLSLRVNRQNQTAIRSYQRNGFAIERQIVSEIGAGFVMDDHWMCAELERNKESGTLDVPSSSMSNVGCSPPVPDRL